MRTAVRLGVAGLALCLLATTQTTVPLSYGPDSAVDLHPASQYVEPDIAASPTDSQKLIAASMSYGAAGFTTETFRSDDGGYNWQTTPLPTGSGRPIADVQTAFDAHGHAYVTLLGIMPSTTGSVNSGLYVFRSSDFGETFTRTAVVRTPDGHGYDHEQLGIDRSASQYSGRVYISVLYLLRLKPQLNGLGLIWSSDGGRTFHGPVQVSKGWSFNSRPVVLSDGTVVFPFIHTEHMNDTTSLVEISTSHDGGASFSKSETISTRVSYSESAVLQKMARHDHTFDGDSVPQFAAFRAPGARQDSVYGIWSDVRSGRSRLLYTRSTDNGKHWSEPRTVFTTSDPADAQYQPSITVNRQGVIGFTWFNGSYSKNSVSEMFTTSSNDGRSFARPVSLSSIASPLHTPAGSVYTADSFADPHGIFVGFSDAGDRYPSGGDYMGLSADGGGAFHAIWIDARNGLDQVWTATAFAGSPPADPPHLTNQTLTKTMALQFGVQSWNAATQTLTIPVRLHNAGTSVLYPPFTATVTMTKNPYYPNAHTDIAILNADNGKRGVGASYVYTAATLGNLGRLLPGANTSERIWKVRINAGATNALFLADVSGYVPAPSQP